MAPYETKGLPRRTGRPFPREEYERRFRSVCRAMAEQGLDGLLVSSPENIFYLTGLDYQGYFAYQLLVVPAEGRPALITRAMERSIIRDKVPNVDHVGYTDGIAPVPEPRKGDADLVLAAPPEQGADLGLRPWSTSLGIPTREEERRPPFVEPARVTCAALVKMGLTKARLGIEKSSSFLPFGIAERIVGGMPRARFEDASDLVNESRMVQSPLELEYTRKAAEISDSMILAAVAASGPDMYKRDVMAAIYQTMFQRGGTYPGFVPLVRSTRTLEHEHGAWEHDRLARRDILFLEMSGCVQRYHAPIGRLVFVGKAPARARAIARVCEEALLEAAKTMRPGVRAEAVYDAWQRHVDRAGLSGYTRHHCGYVVGIGFPPSWSGSGVPVSLRAGSRMELRAGMAFHLMSWLLRTGKGDYFISDTVVVTESGCEFLTKAPRGLTVR